MTPNFTYYQVTDWLQPDDILPTIYGKRRALYWLATEVARWSDKGMKAIIKTENGLVALFGYGIEIMVKPEDTNER